jgi:hypothetical protein
LTIVRVSKEVNNPAHPIIAYDDLHPT